MKIRKNISIDESIDKKLKILSDDTGLNVSQLITYYVNQKYRERFDTDDYETRYIGHKYLKHKK